MTLEKTEDLIPDDAFLPAEWEPCEAVLMAWPHHETDWNYMLSEVQDCFINIGNAISRNASLIVVAPDPAEPEAAFRDNGGAVMENIRFLALPTNDTWTRDFGPITLRSIHSSTPILLDFKFNGWGLKFPADKDNLITSRLHQSSHLKGKLINLLSFVLEGGSIESDGKGTILTTSECLLSPNRNGGMTKDQIETFLLNFLRAKKILWLNHGALEGDDTDSHIDTLARLAPGDTIIYVKCYDKSDPHFASLDAMERELQQMTSIDGKPFNLVPLPLPDPIYDENGERLPATYANFLILNNVVLLPVYNQEENDRSAIRMMEIAFPGYQIIPLDCRQLIRQHGSLHCMTMQLPGQ